MLNALTFDIEDWYQGLESIDFSTWASYESRVAGEIEYLLDILRKNNTKATFFILGYVAEKFPDIVRNIARDQHEIATHGYSHKIIYTQKPSEFTDELKRSINIIEKISQKKVTGFRAPMFSITKASLWAVDILQSSGINFDSSIFPVKNYLYGIPDSPRYPYNIRDGLTEFPISTVRFSGINIPFSGGFYMRLLPYWFIKRSLRKLNAEKKPGIIYLHPFDFDPDIPRINNISLKRKFIHYWNISTIRDKFHALLKDFRFSSIGEVLSKYKPEV